MCVWWWTGHIFRKTRRQNFVYSLLFLFCWNTQFSNLNRGICHDDVTDRRIIFGYHHFFFRDFTLSKPPKQVIELMLIDKWWTEFVSFFETVLERGLGFQIWKVRPQNGSNLFQSYFFWCSCALNPAEAVFCFHFKQIFILLSPHLLVVGVVVVVNSYCSLEVLIRTKF